MPNWLKKIFQTINQKHNSNKLDIYYAEILVATLEYDGEYYIFRYDEKCPDNLRIKGMEDNTIKTKYLPAFFTTRIPSSSRPDLVDSIELYKNDPIKLLSELSSESPISPYVFKLSKSSNL